MNDKKNENIDPNNFFDLQALAETASYLTYSRFMQRICLGAAFAEINLAQGDLFMDRIDHAPPMFEQPSSDEFEDPDFEE